MKIRIAAMKHKTDNRHATTGDLGEGIKLKG